MERGTFCVRKCALAGVEAIEAETDHVFCRHTHDAFAVGRMIDGGQRWWSGRGDVEARKGDMISSNPGEVHDGTPLGATRSWKMLYASPALVADIVRDVSEGRTADFEFTNPVFERSPSAANFEFAYASLTGVPAEPLAAESALTLLFHGLLGGRNRPSTAPSRELARAKERIDSDPASAMSLAELAAESGLSRFQALRGFTRLTGMPPHSYQVQRRLELARSLMTRGTGVSAAAAAAGFADQSHLHRHFVRRFGITPGAYFAALR